MSEADRDTHFYVRDNDLWARSAYVPNKGDVLVVRADLSDALLREAMEVLEYLAGENRDDVRVALAGNPTRTTAVFDAASATLAKLRAHLGEKE